MKRPRFDRDLVETLLFGLGCVLLIIGLRLGWFA